MSENSIPNLFAAMEDLALQFRRLAAAGEPAGTYAAQAIERRAADLKSRLKAGDPLEIVSRLLDVVPDGKDLDAIGINLDLHPKMAAQLDEIDRIAADLSFNYLDD
ncbi:MAG: hypothetical protein B7X90_03640 [Novosphingobium sp. 17-62-19]|uniref:hypothetical protein n=1 Tax=Novosphingobium sp. 17-62-19 TaxID=1970406 RepID=UPI000BC7DE3F|nr:hypothetical protein [Novosphingobium sp. 17-62-19]OZA21038.1 MAG: hypothetical protein B7X90_03640 [Novosphingobium sp. 17-62-19]HQS97358.1 hypothetical protein [Novosphingobium sp.]